MTPTERLARAMGYETRTESPGYGVTRVLIAKRASPYATWRVFNPRSDGLQFAEVLAWLAINRKVPTISAQRVQIDGIPDMHNGTGPDLMRAVCDAAERVAEGMVCSS